jgi:Flp pilus assembly protein TadG
MTWTRGIFDRGSRPSAWPRRRGPDRLCLRSAASAETSSTDHRDFGESGSVTIEFAFLLPILLLVLLGTIQFGLVLKNYVMLTNAVSVGAMQFAISRSNTSPASNTWTALTNAAPNLTPTTNLQMTLSVSGTACVTNANSTSTAASADSTCATALSAAAPSASGTLQPATVNATFPCGTELAWFNFWSSTCQLSSTVSEGVQ